MVAWLRHHGRMSGRDAQRLVTLAKRTRALPVTRAAWASGELSSGQVQAIVANVRRRTVLFSEHEAEVVPSLAPLSLADTIVVLQEWRRRADALDDVPSADEACEGASTLHLSPALDGRGVLDADLDAEDHAIVATAIRVATTDDVDGNSRARRPSAVPMRWSTCAATSWTTRSSSPAGGIGRT
jgi:hypothetical protein